MLHAHDALDLKVMSILDAASYVSAFIFPAAAVLGHHLGGGWNFLLPAIAFGLVPLFDHLIGLDTRNPPDQGAGDIWAYRVVTWLVVPVQLALTVWASWAIARPGLTWIERLGLVLSVGVSNGGLGITVAHELVHRVNNKLEPLLGGLLLTTVCYLHWGLEHVAGHHRNVATPRDPASARFGESFYRFWPRTLWGTLRSASELYSERERRKGRSPWSLRNGMWRAMLLPILFGTALGMAMGPPAVVFFFAQALVAISLLELVNYIEHYGLSRKELRPGTYERVTPRHSWNASHWLTNRLLFMLQRHSDHHAHPGRRYQELRHFDDSPQLPAGYATMVLLALVPPLWRRIMHPRLPDPS